MTELTAVASPQDIPAVYRGGPVGLLLEYHNLNRPLDEYSAAQLLIGTCMDHRVQLRLPEDFAYVIRQGGANLRGSDFTVSFALAVGGVQAIALIGHTQCGMVKVSERQEEFVAGLAERAGWNRKSAEAHFSEAAPGFEIEHEVDFILKQAKRLRSRYPKTQVAPLLYRVEDRRLYLVKEA